MEDNYDTLKEYYANKDVGYYDQQRSEMLEFIPAKTKTVLDIGCSGGGFGALLKQTRPEVEVWGVEPDAMAAQKASDRLDKIINAVFQEGMKELGSKRFDCIVFNDVLEHLVDPVSMLRTAREYLGPNGVVVASIPNILHFYEITDILINQDWKYRSEGILDNTHLRFFTKKSIVRMFTEAGYRVEEIKGINPSYGLKYKISNVLTFGKLRDWKYIQFGVQAGLA